MGTPMIRNKLNRGERPDGRSAEEILQANADSRLVCRDCREPCKAKAAIKAAGRQLRCPGCGGILDREPTNGEE